MRYPEVIMNAIADRYWPLVQSNETDEMVRDSNVLYVGPLLDGIAQFCPEIFGPKEQQNPRYRMKRFARDIVHPSTGRRDGAGEVFSRIIFTRGNSAPIYFTSSFLINEEPGELMNSLEVIRQPGGHLVLQDPVRKDSQTPEIRIIEAAALHYLLKGDRFEFSWETQRKQKHNLLYILKPLADGTSLVTLESPENELTVL